MDLPSILNDRYNLTERLGEGGMAEVFKAEDLRLGREVAVKILRPQYAADQGFLKRFLNEGRAVANFNHPNVVNVFDIGREGQVYYIVMEYVPGTDLRHLLQKRGRLEVREAMGIARQVALGVGRAHQRGLIHRDIKPGNILITPSGEVKVADFGIAKALAGANLTEPGIVWGTTAYLSPEQIRGEPATTASDVYSIGVVLYEMLAGVVPFAGEDRVAVALQHLRERPAPLLERNHRVPRGVQHLVERTLEKDPAARFPDGDALANALGQYLRAGTDNTMAREAEAREAQASASAGATTPATPARRGEAAVPNEVDVEALRARRRERRASGAPLEPVVPVPVPQEAAYDPWSIFLAVILVLLILGLFPLYWLVYNEFAGPQTLAPLGRELASLWMTFLL